MKHCIYYPDCLNGAYEDIEVCIAHKCNHDGCSRKKGKHPTHCYIHKEKGNEENEENNLIEYIQLTWKISRGFILSSIQHLAALLKRSDRIIILRAYANNQCCLYDTYKYLLAN